MVERLAETGRQADTVGRLFATHQPRIADVPSAAGVLLADVSKPFGHLNLHVTATVYARVSGQRSSRRRGMGDVSAGC